MAWPPLLALAGIKRAAIVLAAIPLLMVPWRAYAFAHPIAGLVTSSRTDMRLDAFAVPCLLALIVARRPELLKWITPWMGIVAGALAAAISFRNAADIAFALLLPVLILSTVFHPKSWLARLLELRLMKEIGVLSYSLYLWQQLFCFGFHLPITLRVALTFVAAYCSHRWIELPLIDKGRALTGPR